jgi:hypothetical protein
VPPVVQNKAVQTQARPRKPCRQAITLRSCRSEAVWCSAPSIQLTSFAILGGIWFWWSLSTARVIIDGTKLHYSEGKAKMEIFLGDVVTLSLSTCSFLVKMKNGKSISIPGVLKMVNTSLRF